MNIDISPKGFRRVLSGHPWVFQSDVLAAGEAANPGDIVTVKAGNKFVGQAFYNPHSQITLRMLTRRDEPIDQNFWAARIQAAWDYRRQFCDPQSCRVVHSESDFLPSLIVDKFADVAVLQSLCLGMDKLKPMIAGLIMDIVGPSSVYERNDVPVRRLEGMEEATGLLLGAPVPGRVRIEENGVSLWVDVAHGQKTGYFLDQKENRAALRPLVKDTKVLDCFCHVGSFALHAGYYGAAEVLGLDISEPSVRDASENAALNGLSQTCRFETANVFDYLRAAQAQGDTYDVVVLDPPAFTKSRGTVASAERGYKDINLRAMKLLRDRGFLVTCSCSHHMHTDHFLKTIQDAAQDAHRTLRLMELRSQGKDHPILPAAPETQYLKCAIYQVCQ